MHIYSPKYLVTLVIVFFAIATLTTAEEETPTSSTMELPEGIGAVFPADMPDSEKKKFLQEFMNGLEADKKASNTPSLRDKYSTCPNEVDNALKLLRNESSKEKGLSQLMQTARNGDHLAAKKLQLFFAKEQGPNSKEAIKWQKEYAALSESKKSGSIPGVVLGMESDCISRYEEFNSSP